MYQKEPNKYIIQEDYCILQIQYKDIWYDFLIDLDGVESVKCVHWRVAHKKNKVYAVTDGYDNSKKARVNVYLHSFVLNQCIPKGYEIDHINGNSFDNRKANLRIVTRLKNIQNQNAKCISKSQIKGITYNPAWHSYIVDFYFSKMRFYFNHWKTLPEAV